MTPPTAIEGSSTCLIAIARLQVREEKEREGEDNIYILANFDERCP